MNKLIAVILTLATIAAPAAEIKGNTIILTAEELALCQTGAGCDVFHIDRLAAYVQHLAQKAFGAGQKSCKDQT